MIGAHEVHQPAFDDCNRLPTVPDIFAQKRAGGFGILSDPAALAVEDPAEGDWTDGLAGGGLAFNLRGLAAGLRAFFRLPCVLLPSLRSGRRKAVYHPERIWGKGWQWWVGTHPTTRCAYLTASTRANGLACVGHGSGLKPISHLVRIGRSWAWVGINTAVRR
jgi:hypothetical protein